MLKRKSVFVVAVILALMAGFAATAIALQTGNVRNPSAIEFTPSADHAQIDSYQVEWVNSSDTVVATISVGKPTVGTGNLITTTVSVQSLPFGINYYAKIYAVAGSARSDAAISVNKFDRVPGPPSNGKVK